MAALCRLLPGVDEDFRIVQRLRRILRQLGLGDALRAGGLHEGFLRHHLILGLHAGGPSHGSLVTDLLCLLVDLLGMRLGLCNPGGQLVVLLLQLHQLCLLLGDVLLLGLGVAAAVVVWVLALGVEVALALPLADTAGLAAGLVLRQVLGGPTFAEELAALTMRPEFFRLLDAFQLILDLLILADLGLCALLRVDRCLLRSGHRCFFLVLCLPHGCTLIFCFLERSLRRGQLALRRLLERQGLLCRLDRLQGDRRDLGRLRLGLVDLRLRHLPVACAGALRSLAGAEVRILLDAGAALLATTFAREALPAALLERRDFLHLVLLLIRLHL
mmetsp:Transcript_4007/g.11172  ORF Transcript_4007/g.11172 Transcript_4007/m.11172 type:complete len:330 (+) Transcript_4007:470-1459(+)